MRLLLPRSGYAPQQKSEPQEVGITAEADNDTLGGLFLAGWSILHALALTPQRPAVKWVASILGDEREWTRAQSLPVKRQISCNPA